MYCVKYVWEITSHLIIIVNELIYNATLYSNYCSKINKWTDQFLRESLSELDKISCADTTVKIC